MKYDTFTIESNTYRKEFWNTMMKGKPIPYNTMGKGNVGSDMFVIPYDSNRMLMEHLKENCVFRNIATNITTLDSDLDI